MPKLEKLNMKKLIIALTLLFINPLFSQEEEFKSIDTKEQNDQWNTKFKTENLEQQIRLIQERLLSDSNIFYTPTNAHGETQLPEGFKSTTQYRPLYILKSQNSEPILLESNMSKERVSLINSHLTENNVENISFSNDMKSQSLYGARAKSGLITINFSDEKVLEKLATKER